MIWTLAQVALGGAIGAALRQLTNLGMLRLAGTGFPYATLAINVLGSFLIGVLVVALAGREGLRLAPFLITGVLGGYTTFSAFSLDTLVLVERGDTGLALVYVAASVALSLLAVTAGVALARGVWA